MSEEKSKVHWPKHRFDCQEIQKSMHEILHQNLHVQRYDVHQLKTLGYERYKFLIQIFISQEQKESLQMTCRSYWDFETDHFAQSIYINQFLICIAIAFAIFYYGRKYRKTPSLMSQY